MSVAGGYAAAVGAAIMNGSFGTISKAERVKKHKIPFAIFGFWTSMGIVISTIPFLAATPRYFTPWGLLSGACFSISMGSTFLALQKLGLGSGNGVWCGTSILVSFTWAVRVQGETISTPGLAAPGIILLVGGLGLIAVNGQAASSRERQAQQAEQNEYGHLEEEGDEERGSADQDPSTSQKKKIDVKGYPLGIGAAILAGVFGGLVLGPMYFAPEWGKGLQYMPSMAFGVLISSPIVTLLITALARKDNPSWSFHPKTAALPGILSGTIWNIGNALSIIATTNPKVGLGVAYPLMQAGMFVAGLWGIFLFNELKLVREQVMYWIGGLILIGGAIMLAASK